MNAACKDVGAPLPHPEDPSDCTLVPVPPPYEPGWRLCSNFCALNTVTKVPTFPTGDLAAKQSKMAGHGWLPEAGSTAHEMINYAFREMMGTDMETIMNDNIEADNNWKTLFNKLTRTFQLTCENGLSISPSKLKLFIKRLV
ncbi:hypothetical protein M422DRAFT_275621 [Sphaerobolus stellatus SS14]|uniref:Uncharacterized protein n=1 Tax=Sphaerobolus stellatus (strain SS14) TaxID=990650 RepID=A0A0C9TP87_SPHS4|nr:hypothetical protein M422DRAFT_275621 [Sphaerobolus stellatus SS14]